MNTILLAIESELRKSPFKRSSTSNCGNADYLYVHSANPMTGLQYGVIASAKIYYNDPNMITINTCAGPPSYTWSCAVFDLCDQINIPIIINMLNDVCSDQIAFSTPNA
jgi:hypothetical protein